MAEITSTSTFTKLVPELGAKMLMIETVATADDGDTIVVDMSDYGMSQFLGILGQTHSTTDSVVITEAPTTAVSSGDLTITVGGSTDNKKRVFIVWGR